MRVLEGRLALLIAGVCLIFASSAIAAHRVAEAAGSIASGETHTCAVTEAGTVKCWGLNGNAQLGDGTGIDSTVRVDVGGDGTLLEHVRAVAAGYLHACAALD